MVQSRVVIACSQCGAFWDPAAEPASCRDSSHDHRRFESHLHRSRVALPDSTELTGVSFGSASPYARDAPPDFGLYLDERWRPPWSHDHLDWPDFGVPDDPYLVVTVLGSLLDRAQAGQRVEIGCYGGHGRTGTALACLAILCGLPPNEAVSWVRSEYCERAVETERQEAFARNLTR